MILTFLTYSDIFFVVIFVYEINMLLTPRQIPCVGNKALSDFAGSDNPVNLDSVWLKL